MPSPTSRSLQLLKENGYVPWISEHYNAFAHFRRDLYGFIDIVALHPDYRGILAIQTTTGSNTSAREAKILGLPVHRLWVSCGNRIQIHGWRKLKGHWKCRILEYENGTFKEEIAV